MGIIDKRNFLVFFMSDKKTPAGANHPCDSFSFDEKPQMTAKK